MNRKFVFWLVLFLVLLSGVLWVFVGQGGSLDSSGGPDSATLPGSSSQNQGSQNSEATIQIQGTDGSAIVATVKDFLHASTTIADIANPGRYLLAGNLGYCISDPSECQAAPADGFNVFYDTSTQSFTVSLLMEPLGTVRARAEAFLKGALGLTGSQLCDLNYYVGTTARVNSAYADGNLGFSACSGATALP